MKAIRFQLAMVTAALVLLLAPLPARADGIELAGDVLELALPVTAGGVTVGLRDWQGSLELGLSEGVTLGATYALKYSLNTRRPNGGKHSFPSEHAAVSFSAAEFLRKRYGWTAGIPAYAAASFVAYSRVESNNHFPADVVCGAALGIVTSYLFTEPYHGWEVKTDAGPALHGLFLSRNW